MRMDFAEFVDYVALGGDTQYEFAELTNGLYKAIASDNSHVIMIDPCVPSMWGYAQFHSIQDEHWQWIVGWGSTVECAITDWKRECEKFEDLFTRFGPMTRLH
mgnify:CR=1 FL=1